MRGFDRIIGQTEVVLRLKAFAELYRTKGEPPGHVFLTGQEGIGKRAIASAFAEELGGTLKKNSGSEFERKGDLTAQLTSMDRNDVLFIEGVQRVKQSLWEVLIPGLRDFRIGLNIGVGREARVHPYALNRFTCVATAFRESDCPRELKELFPLKISLRPYSDAELQRIAVLVAESMGLFLVPRVASIIVAASSGNPHQVEVLLRHIAGTSSYKVTEEVAKNVLEVFGLGGSSPDLPGVGNAFENLSGVEFERLIVRLVEQMGFRAEMTKASGDGGIDIVAVLDKPVVGGRFLIQCKRYTPQTPVGARLVREFYGALVADRRAVKGILITTSSFTDQAREFARELPLELIELEQLRQMLTNHGM